MLDSNSPSTEEVVSSDVETVRPLTSLRPVQVNQTCWYYKWDGPIVQIVAADQQTYEIPTWEVLEITKSEYAEWCNDPGGGPVVTSKDVGDFIKENILRKSMARKIAGKFSEAS